MATIVITTYHRPDRISRAVDSALAQTCDKEIIVVDDNGKDTDWHRQTAEQMAVYVGQVTYLVNEVNLGVSNARNRALAIAEGKYITFLDDDDEIAPTKLEKQIQRMEELGEDYSCCYCAYIKYLSRGRITTVTRHWKGTCSCRRLPECSIPEAGQICSCARSI